MDCWFYLCVILCFISGKAFASQCYQCSARDGETCKQKQFQKTCADKKSKCMTITYYKNVRDENKTIAKHTFKKGCVVLSDCNVLCKFVQASDGHNCMISCCSGKLCNKSVKKDVIWYSRVRRSHNGCSLNRKNMTWIMILLLIFTVLNT